VIAVICSGPAGTPAEKSAQPGLQPSRCPDWKNHYVLPMAEDMLSQQVSRDYRKKLITVLKSFHLSIRKTRGY